MLFSTENWMDSLADKLCKQQSSCRFLLPQSHNVGNYCHHVKNELLLAEISDAEYIGSDWFQLFSVEKGLVDHQTLLYILVSAPCFCFLLRVSKISSKTQNFFCSISQDHHNTFNF